MAEAIKVYLEEMATWWWQLSLKSEDPRSANETLRREVTAVGWPQMIEVKIG